MKAIMPKSWQRLPETVAQSVSGMSERNARLIHDKWLSELEENLKGLKKAERGGE